MSTTRKFLFIVPSLVFVLACQLISKPINDMKQAASTVQSVGTQAIEFATQAAPLETVMANPSAIPNIASTALPDGNMLDPEGDPVSAWKDIPVMPQATAGQEVEGVYSYKVSVKMDDVKSFYAETLPPLGWKESLSMPGTGDATLLLYEKDSQILTITIMSQSDHLVVLLTTQ